MKFSKPPQRFDTGFIATANPARDNITVTRRWSLISATSPGSIKQVWSRICTSETSAHWSHRSKLLVFFLAIAVSAFAGDPAPALRPEDVPAEERPKEVLLKQPLNIPLSHGRIVVPAGNSLVVIGAENGKLLVRHHQIDAKCDPSITDFWARADQIAKKIQEQKAAAAQRAQEEINAAHTAELEAARQRVERLGPKPARGFSGYPCVQEYIKRRLKDPYSVKWNEWSEPIVINKDGEIYWLVKVIYRAKNSFGAYGIGAAAYIRNDVVVHYEEIH